MRDTPADVVSLELAINPVNTDLSRLRALGPAVHGLRDTSRDGHPDAPAARHLASAVSDARGHLEPTVPDLSALSEGRMLYRASAR
jgi:hypothetical protein